MNKGDWVNIKFEDDLLGVGEIVLTGKVEDVSGEWFSITIGDTSVEVLYSELTRLEILDSTPTTSEKNPSKIGVPR